MPTIIPGKVFNLPRYKQIVDFSGLIYERGITPTDIDGVLDFGGRLFVLIELKCGNSPMPLGQQLCLERLCDRLSISVNTIVLVGQHNSLPNQEIDAASTIITDFRWLDKWHVPKQTLSIREGIDKLRQFIESADIKPAKVVEVDF